MEIEIPNAIKLFFSNSSLPLVYFEALANSLDAGATKVSIDIDIQAFDQPETLKITVSDNGDGFNEDNFDRFKTLLKPRDGLHKGIGRLVFLNYFKSVEITSNWNNKLRQFVFKEGFRGDAPVQEVQSEQANNTTLVFTNFTKSRVYAYDDLKPASLKSKIIEQFLPKLYSYKRTDKPFKISINLVTRDSNDKMDFGSDETTITPSDLPKLTVVTIQDQQLDAFASINMLYHIQPDTIKGRSLIGFNIDGRTIAVDLVPPSAIPTDHRCLFLFESELFQADSALQKLVLPDEIQPAILYSILRREMGTILAAKIPQITEKNKRTKDQFEAQFPHLLGYFDDDIAGLIDANESLTNAQQRFFKDQKQILQCETLNDQDYEKSLELSSCVLMEYILYRHKIINRMKSTTPDNTEADLHNLIVPRFQKFSGDSVCSDIYQNNTWLLDEKFMVFRTILSEQRMDTIINAIRLDDEKVVESGRPDIARIFSADPDNAMPVDVVIVEIKKKTEEEKENQNAINQLADRATKLITYCPHIQRMWYYAVIHISNAKKVRLQQMNWTPLFSKGEVYYQELKTARPDATIAPTPTFVVSFDSIVADAECRNNIFMEIMRNGMKKFTEA
ncbi:MAG: ATP-binding protein [Streptococcaceae bacterium]|nr:ATP-binding protein [Streptococcaceae bacterium]